MGWPQTSSPPGDHSVWYAYSLKIGGTAIGSFERFSARSTRTAERIREIMAKRGAEVVEIVWGGTDTSVDLSFVELYEAAIFEQLGYNIYALEDFQTRIDIVEVMKLPDDPGGNRVITYHDAVPSDWGKDIDTGGTKVVETMTFQIRKVSGRRTS